MKTGEIAALVASIRGGNPPKRATKAKAVELFWKAAESLPKTPEPAPGDAHEAKRIGRYQTQDRPPGSDHGDPGHRKRHRRPRAGGEDSGYEPRGSSARGGDQGRGRASLDGRVLRHRRQV